MNEGSQQAIAESTKNIVNFQELLNKNEIRKSVNQIIKNK